MRRTLSDQLPSLDGRAFAADADVAGGDVGPATVFRYREAPDGAVEAHYAGGAVRSGHLVGTRDGDTLRFRYTQLRHDGTTASGRCTSEMGGTWTEICAYGTAVRVRKL